MKYIFLNVYILVIFYIYLIKIKETIKIHDIVSKYSDNYMVIVY